MSIETEICSRAYGSYIFLHFLAVKCTCVYDTELQKTPLSTFSSSDLSLKKNMEIYIREQVLQYTQLPFAYSANAVAFGVTKSSNFHPAKVRCPNGYLHIEHVICIMWDYAQGIDHSYAGFIYSAYNITHTHTHAGWNKIHNNISANI